MTSSAFWAPSLSFLSGKDNFSYSSLFGNLNLKQNLTSDELMEISPHLSSSISSASSSPSSSPSLSPSSLLASSLSISNSNLSGSTAVSPTSSSVHENSSIPNDLMNMSTTSNVSSSSLSSSPQIAPSSNSLLPSNNLPQLNTMNPTTTMSLTPSSSSTSTVSSSMFSNTSSSSTTIDPIFFNDMNQQCNYFFSDVQQKNNEADRNSQVQDTSFYDQKNDKITLIKEENNNMAIKHEVNNNKITTLNHDSNNNQCTTSSPVLNNEHESMLFPFGINSSSNSIPNMMLATPEMGAYSNIFLPSPSVDLFDLNDEASNALLDEGWELDNQDSFRQRRYHRLSVDLYHFASDLQVSSGDLQLKKDHASSFPHNTNFENSIQTENSTIPTDFFCKTDISLLKNTNIKTKSSTPKGNINLQRKKNIPSTIKARFDRPLKLQSFNNDNNIKNLSTPQNFNGAYNAHNSFFDPHSNNRSLYESISPLSGIASNYSSSILSPDGPKTFDLQRQTKIGIYSPKARKERIQRFHEKRKTRVWQKRIKYDCRKTLAAARPRYKGRFVKVDETVSVASLAAAAAAAAASVTNTNSTTTPVDSAVISGSNNKDNVPVVNTTVKTETDPLANSVGSMPPNTMDQASNKASI